MGAPIGSARPLLLGALALGLGMTAACVAGDRNVADKRTVAAEHNGAVRGHVFVFLRPDPSNRLTDEQHREIGAGHMANIQRLASEGILIFAGPTGDGGGVFLLRANTLVEARAILATDPAVAAGALIPDAFNVEISNGRTCVAATPITMMHRDMVSGTAGRSEYSLRQLLALGERDLLVVSADGRFVVIFDGETSLERRDSVRRFVADTGVVIIEIADLYSPVGALCDNAS